MPKLRKPGSIENGLEEVIQILSEEEIMNAIGKTSSYLRKCSDPGEPNEIKHNEFYKLDLACIKKNKAPPLLNVYEYMISKKMDLIEFKGTDTLNEVLVRFTLLHGKLIEKIKDAKKPESDKGAEISGTEKKEIFKAIKDLDNKILKLKIMVDKGN